MFPTFRALFAACIFAPILLVLATDNVAAGWKLTFSDEFESPKLDRTKWKFGDIWSNGTLPGNKERQCYVPSAVSQLDGKLRLTATKEFVSAKQCKAAKFDLDYKSGMITTAGCNQYERQAECLSLRQFGQTYGYFEMMAKLPKGKGLWPAFWLLPTDASWPPEIDVVEVLGHEVSKLFVTYHFKDAAGQHRKVGGPHVGPDLSASFNAFGLDWQPNKLVWYLNGRELFRHTGDNVSSKRMYVLINLAVGGVWPGDPDASTPFPSTMEVDYVRVYQRTGDGSPDERPPNALPAAAAPR
jgi:beta-glucanase (GH16 family)